MVAGYGSIPANTGRSRSGSASRPARRVHPREHGAVSAESGSKPVRHGPSPRTRGGLPIELRARRRMRSIPANTGRSGSDAWRGERVSVHPREHGAVVTSCYLIPKVSGPSPRTRGGHQCAAFERHAAGSIPANTGRSEVRPVYAAERRVHPREHGAVFAVTPPAIATWGPSPRTRGGPARSGQAAARHGSIPANTGRSVYQRALRTRTKVHPREHGAVG